MMTNDEAVDIILEYDDAYVYTKEYMDKYNEAIGMAIKALEKENSDKQRYVVRGINNDKIEFVDKYSVRAFNRYVEFITHDTNKVLDKIIDEIEEIYMNITYQENKDKKATWGLRKALSVIYKYNQESEEI